MHGDHKIQTSTAIGFKWTSKPQHEPGAQLDLDSIGVISIETKRAIFFDAYRDNRITGAAILIDPETNGTAGALMMNLVNVAAAMSVAEQESKFGILYQTAPDKCCGFRKVEPLFGAIENYDTWFTALRREQSPTRANLQHVEDFKLPTGKIVRKISPLVEWTWPEVWAYVKGQGLPFLPLHDQGYTSVGCAPCTARPADPENLRSGRWGGKKLECGIHIQADEQHA